MICCIYILQKNHLVHYEKNYIKLKKLLYKVKKFINHNHNSQQFTKINEKTSHAIKYKINMHSILFVMMLMLSILLSYFTSLIIDIKIASSLLNNFVHGLIFLIFCVCGIINPYKKANKLDKIEKYSNSGNYEISEKNNIKVVAKYIIFVQIISFLLYPLIGIILGSFLSMCKFNKNLLLGFMVNKINNNCK